MSGITHHFQINTQSAVTIILMKVAHHLIFNCFVSSFTLDWLRLNCMKIFQYLPNQLKGVAIFKNDHRKIDKNKESGAVFNDFDFQPDELLSSTYNDIVF